MQIIGEIEAKRRTLFFPKNRRGWDRLRPAATANAGRYRIGTFGARAVCFPRVYLNQVFRPCCGGGCRYYLLFDNTNGLQLALVNCAFPC